MVMHPAPHKPHLDQIPLRIAVPVQLEPQKPSRTGLSPERKPGGHLMAVDVMIITHA
jgi:hypothetical protein